MGKNNTSEDSKAKGRTKHPRSFTPVVRDLTRRKDIEEKLRELEERYRTMVDHAYDWIWMVDKDGKFIYVNKTAERESGYTFKEGKGKSFAPIIVPEDLPYVQEIFARTLKGESITYDVRIYNITGNILTLEVNTAPIRQKGEIVSTVSFGRDVTKRKQTEERYTNQLRSFIDVGNKMRMELGLETLLQNICGTVVNTLGWRQVILSLRDYNTGTSRPVAMAGYDKETTKKILSKPPVPLEAVERHLRDEFKISRSYYINHTHWEIMKDYPAGIVVVPRADSLPGGWHEKDVLLIPIYGREKILGFISPDNPVNGKRPTENDIRLFEIFADQAGVAIESSRLYAKLRTSEEKYRAVCENSLTAIYIFQDRKLRFVNRQFEKISGYSRDELLGMEFWKLVHPEDREMVKERELERREKGEERRERGEDIVSSYEFRGIRKNGKAIWFGAMASTIKYQGRRAVLGNLIDITERKMAKLELERYIGKLEELNEAKSRFVSTFSHDIRTPLTTISGYISLLLSKKWGDLTQEQEDRMRKIFESARYINNLIDKVLDLSRIESGKTPITLQKVNPAEIIEKSIEDFAPIAKEKEQSIKFTGDRSVNTAYADPKAMQRILNNLLDNAVKYTARDGKIEVSLIEKEEFIQINVKDNGQGIPKEELDNIFREFYTLPNRSGEVTRSTGLGLSIVKRLIDTMGGTVWVESEGVDRGSTFSFTLNRGVL